MQLTNRRILEQRTPAGSDSLTYSLSHDFMVPEIRSKNDPKELARVETRRMLKRSMVSFQDTGTLLDSKQIQRIEEYILPELEEKQNILLLESKKAIEEAKKHEAQQEAEKARLKAEKARSQARLKRAGWILGSIVLGLLVWGGIQTLNLRTNTFRVLVNAINTKSAEALARQDYRTALLLAVQSYELASEKNLPELQETKSQLFQNLQSSPELLLHRRAQLPSLLGYRVNMPDSILLISNTDSSGSFLTLLNLNTDETQAVKLYYAGTPWFYSYLPQSNSFILAGTSQRGTGFLQIIDTSTGKLRGQRIEYDKSIYELKVSPDGKTVGVIVPDSRPNNLELIDVNSAAPITPFPTLSYFPNNMAFHPSEPVVAIQGSSSDSAYIALYNFRSHEFSQTVHGNPGNWRGPMMINSTGSHVFNIRERRYSGKGSIDIWNLQNDQYTKIEFDSTPQEVTLSKDKKRLAFVINNESYNEVHVYDTESMTPVGEPISTNFNIYALSFSTTNDTLAIGGSPIRYSYPLEGVINLVAVDSMHILQSQTFRYAIKQLSFDPFGEFLAVFSGTRLLSELELVDVLNKSTQVPPITTVDGDINHLQFSADGSRLAFRVEKQSATGNDRTKIEIYDLAISKYHTPDRKNYVATDAVLYSSQQDYLVIGGRDEGESFLDIIGAFKDTLYASQSLGKRPILTMVLAPNDQSIAIGYGYNGTGSSSIEIIELSTLETQYHYESDTRRPASTFKYSPDGRHLAVSGGELRMLIAEAGNSKERDKTKIISRMRYNEEFLEIIDLFSGDVQTVSDSLFSLGFGYSFNLDGSKLIFVAPDTVQAHIHLYDILAKSISKTIQAEGLLTAIDYNAYTNQVVAALWQDTSNTVQFIDIQTGMNHTDSLYYPGPVLKLVSSPDGRVLAIGGGKRHVDDVFRTNNTIHNTTGFFQLIEPGSQEPLTELTYLTQVIRDITFSPQSNYVALTTELEDQSNLRIIDLNTYQQIGEDLSVQMPIKAVHFSESNNVAVALLQTRYSENGLLSEVVFIDLLNGGILGLRVSDLKDIHQITINPDGDQLALAGNYVGNDQESAFTEQIDIYFDSWIDQACEIAYTNFTETEWKKHFGDLQYECTCPNLPCDQ